MLSKQLTETRIQCTDLCVSVHTIAGAPLSSFHHHMRRNSRGLSTLAKHVPSSISSRASTSLRRPSTFTFLAILLEAHAVLGSALVLLQLVVLVARLSALVSPSDSFPGSCLAAAAGAARPSEVKKSQRLLITSQLSCQNLLFHRARTFRFTC